MLGRPGIAGAGPVHAGGGAALAERCEKGERWQRKGGEAGAMRLLFRRWRGPGPRLG